MKPKSWIYLFLGVLVVTVACGLSEQAPTRTPNAARDAQRTAQWVQSTSTQSAIETRYTTLNATVVAEVSAWSTESARQLSVKLTQLSTELQFTPSDSTGEGWLTRWLTHPACQPPCWENIIPGVTTLDEAARIVFQLPGTEITALPSIPGLLEGQKTLSWYIDQSDYCFIETYNNEIIVPYLAFRLGDERNLLLGEAMAAFGNPSAVVKDDCVDSIPSRCDYQFVFRDKGMILYTDYQKSKIVDVQAGTHIRDIYLYPLESIASVAAGASIEWSGYGEYDFTDK